MTSKEKIEDTRGVILGLLELDDINVVHKEYLNSLLFRIDNEVIPFSETIPDEAVTLLFTEVLKTSSIISFSRDNKPASCRVTKRILAKFFPKDDVTFEGFEKLKESRYGLTVLNMNINHFFKIKGSGRKER